MAYFVYQRKLRRAKAIERGLKMVPIQIHLPPASDDTEGGSRDVKEVMREKTSQAEVLYNLLAGTTTTGFKSNFYGQRHVALELIATGGLVHFFAAVPIALVSTVEKAIQSAYPGARLEEVEDHNIFNQEGRLAATMGGELVLKNDSAYPIATYSTLERDPLEAIITTLSGLKASDGAAIQIMVRPANPHWVQSSIKLTDKIRRGRHQGLGFDNRQLVKALVKPPTSQYAQQEGRPSQMAQLSQIELATIEKIEEKTKQPGFEVLIRVVVSTESVATSQQLLRDLATSFALFDAPGLNGFKFLPALDVQGLVTAFIFRFFPPEMRGSILNSAELATIFHLPDYQFTPTTNVERQKSKEVDGPVSVPAKGLLFGFNEFRGVKKEIRLADEDRRRHTYILGQTGTGKSVMLENLALQDMQAGRGFALIDPHGDLAEKLLTLVPKERAEDVIYFNPADMDFPLGLNLFEYDDPAQKDFIVQETIEMLYKLYDPGKTGIIGPRYEHWYRNAALTLMSDPNGSTFIEIPKVFTDTNYLKAKFKYLKDPTVIEFWTKEMAQTSDYHKSEMLGWFVSKFGAFQNNEMMRNIIGQTQSAFKIRDVMDNQKILIVNLSKGRIGELNSKLLGMIFVIKFQAAAMSRASMTEVERKDFSLYVDEFQNFSTDSFATILSEARKYRLNLIVANQFIGQLSNEIRDAVFGNIGTIVAHRMGPEDAEFMVKQFTPVFEVHDLVNFENLHSAVRMMIGGLPSQPFTMTDSPWTTGGSAEMGLAIKQLSAAKYGTPKAEVEADIAARFASGSAAVPPPTPAATEGVAQATETTPWPGDVGAGAVGAAEDAMSADQSAMQAQVPAATPLAPEVAQPTSAPVAAPAPPQPIEPASNLNVAPTDVPAPVVSAPPAHPVDSITRGAPLAASAANTAPAEPLAVVAAAPVEQPLIEAPPIGAPPIEPPVAESSAHEVVGPPPQAPVVTSSPLETPIQAPPATISAVHTPLPSISTLTNDAPATTVPPIGAPPVELETTKVSAPDPAALSIQDITGGVVPEEVQAIPLIPGEGVDQTATPVRHYEGEATFSTPQTPSIERQIDDPLAGVPVLASPPPLEEPNPVVNVQPGGEPEAPPTNPMDGRSEAITAPAEPASSTSTRPQVKSLAPEQVNQSGGGDHGTPVAEPAALSDEKRDMAQLNNSSVQKATVVAEVQPAENQAAETQPLPSTPDVPVVDELIHFVDPKLKEILDHNESGSGTETAAKPSATSEAPAPSIQPAAPASASEAASVILNENDKPDPAGGPARATGAAPTGEALDHTNAAKTLTALRDDADFRAETPSIETQPPEEPPSPQQPQGAAIAAPRAQTEPDSRSTNDPQEAIAAAEHQIDELLSTSLIVGNSGRHKLPEPITETPSVDQDPGEPRPLAEKPLPTSPKADPVANQTPPPAQPPQTRQNSGVVVVESKGHHRLPDAPEAANNEEALVEVAQPHTDEPGSATQSEVSAEPTSSVSGARHTLQPEIANQPAPANLATDIFAVPSVPSEPATSSSVEPTDEPALPEAESLAVAPSTSEIGATSTVVPSAPQPNGDAEAAPSSEPIAPPTTPPASEPHVEPPLAQANVGNIILPSASEQTTPVVPTTPPEAPEPPKLAPGEVFVDDKGNVIIGE